MQDSRILASIGRRIEESGLPLAVRLWNGAAAGAAHPQVTISVRNPLALAALGLLTLGCLSWMAYRRLESLAAAQRADSPA